MVIIYFFKFNMIVLMKGLNTVNLVHSSAHMLFKVDSKASEGCACFHAGDSLNDQVLYRANVYKR